MRWSAIALGAALILALAPATSGAQTSCTIAPVFAPFREAVGAETVGECSSDPSTSPTGDLTQATTRGTLFRRAKDGLLLFSNDTTIWLDGPEGLQSRSNGDQLAWEVQQEAPAAAQPASSAAPPAPATKSTAALEQRCSEIVNGAPDRGQPTRDQQWGICVQLAEEYGAPGVDCYAEATRKIAPHIGKVSRETTNALFDASLTGCKAALR